MTQIAGLELRPVKWSDFKGEVDQSMPWAAHIYWRIDYNITDYKKKKVDVRLILSSRSWVRQDKKNSHLLNH